MIDLQKINFSLPVYGEHVKIDLFCENNITNEYLNWLNDPIVVKFSKQREEQHTYQTSLKFLNSYIKSQNDIFLAIYLKNENTYIGTMTINFSDEYKEAELRILIGEKKYWGKGLGKDSWGVMLNSLLAIPGLNKVFAGAVESNAAMIEIMHDSGMVLEKVMDDYDFLDGRPQKAFIFSKFTDK